MTPWSSTSSRKPASCIKSRRILHTPSIPRHRLVLRIQNPCRCAQRRERRLSGVCVILIRVRRTHTRRWLQEPAFKGRASLLTREVCNIRGNASMARTGAYTRSACGRPSDRRGARRDRGEHAPGAKGRMRHHACACGRGGHAPMGSKSPAFKGRASLLTREVCNIRGNASMARTGAYTRSACGRPSDRRGARRDRGEHAPGAKGTNAASRVRVWQGRAAGTVRQMIGAALRPEIRALRPRSLSN